MLYTDENNLGKILFDEKIIANIIRKTIDGFNGKVMLSGSKGRIKKTTEKAKHSDDSSFMNMKKTDDAYTIDVYVVLKFGTSIRKTSNDMINIIRDQVQNITGMKVQKVRVIITGMLSKNFTKRHIEVEG